MSDYKVSTDPFVFRIIDTNRNCYRDYHFIDDSKEIINKIVHHIMYFGQNTKFHDHKDILEVFASLCHKINILKHHLKRYKEVESALEKELLMSENFIDHDGSVLIEKIELTAEYESFLIQVKATLDILVKFLNIIYRECKNPLKDQSTFSDGGNGVIKSLEKYLKSHPEDSNNVSELLNYLKSECTETKNQDSETIHWLLSIIDKRDTVAHFRKHEYFAFQINYVGKKKNIIPPMFTSTQTILESLEIAYDNLLVFIQDFIALLFIPYLDKKLKAFTYRREEVVADAPKWYLQLGDLSPQSIINNSEILSFIKKHCDEDEKRLTPEYCEKMYTHYASFYGGKGDVGDFVI